MGGRSALDPNEDFAKRRLKRFLRCTTAGEQFGHELVHRGAHDLVLFACWTAGQATPSQISAQRTNCSAARRFLTLPICSTTGRAAHGLHSLWLRMRRPLMREKNDDLLRLVDCVVPATQRPLSVAIVPPRSSTHLSTTSVTANEHSGHRRKDMLAPIAIHVQPTISKCLVRRELAQRQEVNRADEGRCEV